MPHFHKYRTEYMSNFYHFAFLNCTFNSLLQSCRGQTGGLAALQKEAHYKEKLTFMSMYSDAMSATSWHEPIMLVLIPVEKGAQGYLLSHYTSRVKGKWIYRTAKLICQVFSLY